MGLLQSPSDKPLNGQEIEKEYCRLPKFALRWVGFWPYDNILSYKVLPLMIFSSTIVTLSILTELAYCYTHIHNLQLTLDALSVSLTKIVTVIKFVMLFLTRTKVAKLLDQIKQNWIDDKSPESSYQNLRATQNARTLTMILICFSTSASIGNYLGPIVIMARQYFTGEPLIRSMPYKSEYPYDEYADSNYALTYFFDGLTGTITAFGLSGVDGIFATICLHISAQFRILKHDFQLLTANLQSAAENDTYSVSANGDINKRLKQLIIRHEQTIRLNDDMVKLFTINTFSHIVSAALSLGCVSVNLLLLTEDTETFIYVCFIIAATTQLLIFCAGGTLLQITSLEIHDAAYFTDWYKWDTRNQRQIGMVILRSQRPCGIVVPFFESSLATFSSIMRLTSSYIALLRTLLD